MKTLKNIKTLKLLAILFISSLAFTACKDDDHDEDDHDHEEELITTVTYKLTNGKDIVVLTFEDLDGDGSAQPTYNVSGPLKANTTYTGEIKLENKSETPAEDITEEVQKESDEHEFFYTSTVNGIVINKTDVDSNSNPLGIKTTLTTGAAGTGTLTVILKHEPSKPNSGTSSSAGGSTDVEVTFNISIQ